MRILQIVTYISPDGAYGGPVRVAINQAKALTELGHDVVVAAAAGGFAGGLPTEFDGFPVRLFRARRLVPKSGFAGLTSPGLVSWIVQAIRGADVVHVHLARDLVSLPTAAMALLMGKPLVIQTHGMIDHSDKTLATILDKVLTRPILQNARHVLYLTDREHKDLLGVARRSLHLVHLPNGVPVPDNLAVEQVDGPSRAPEALYLARLHPRKRPMVFVQAAKAIAPTAPQAHFALVGPDEGEGPAIRAALNSQDSIGRITWTGPVPPNKTLDRMREAAVYILPSTDEPFPMSVLEAMSVGLPVIITDSCGLARMVQTHEAGIVCSNEPTHVEKALARLLTDDQLRLEMGLKAREAIKKGYSMSSIAGKLSSIYKASGKLQEVSE